MEIFQWIFSLKLSYFAIKQWNMYFNCKSFFHQNDQNDKTEININRIAFVLY